MMDYKKLQLAHELLIKNDEYYLKILFSKNIETDEYILSNHMKPKTYCFKDLDSLINKLKELNSPKPQFNVGDTIWFLDCEQEIHSLKVEEIIYDQGQEKTRYSQISTGNFVWSSTKLYASRDELIDSKIEYWKSMR